MPPRALTYSSYLALDELLAAQRPESAEHDELLFIVVHQVYELWFKQLLHEGGLLARRLRDGETIGALHTVRRVLTVLKTLVAQVDVLETMTPSQFTAFRDRLDAASGFQSAQFRRLEALLGRRDEAMLRPYDRGSPEHRAIAAALAAPSLFDALLHYLHRQGHPVPRSALDVDPAVRREPSPSVQRAILAAYREDGEAAQVCERMVDLDEGVMEWRYRHVQMVRRTIGERRGTGGSDGVRYLAGTLLKPAFPDLWAVRSEL
jgi:tryptophan 2,3-dioxygenase